MPRRNVRTKKFKSLYSQLPEKTQALAVDAFKLFCKEPDHPSLLRHPLADTKKGQHRKGSVSVAISLKYRAIYVEDGNDNVWYWIGSHSDYNTFTGRKKG